MATFDGVAKKGKTVGKQIGIDGPKAPIQNGGKAKHGVANAGARVTMGRNLARAANQKRGG
jgi:hypothetical protein